MRYGKQNKEIIELKKKKKMDDLNNQIIEKDQEINQIVVTLETCKIEMRDAQRRMKGAFKELNHNRSALNDL